MKKINFKNIFRSLTLPCLVLEPKGEQFVILDASAAFIEITGTSREELLGMLSCDAFPRNPKLDYYGGNSFLESLQRVARRLEAEKIDLLRYDVPIRGTYEFMEKYWRPENVPVLDDEGALEYILHIVEDVTAQVVSENKEQEIVEELAKTKQQYHHFIETNTDGLYSLDKDGNFTSVNEGLEKISGVCHAELLRMSFLPFCSPDDREYVLAHFQLALKGEAVKFEAKFISAQGRHMILDVSLVPIEVKGEVLGAYGITKDITNIRETEQVVIEKRKILQANASFISSLLDHELEEESLQEALEVVGNAIGVDRICYFERTFRLKGEEKLFSQKFEWRSDRISGRPRPPLPDMTASTVSELLGILVKDQPYMANLSRLPNASLKELLIEQGIKAILVLPVFLDGELHGFLGFDDCRGEREWKEDEILFSRSLANNLSANQKRRFAEAAVQEREEALRRSEQKFRALVQEGSDMLGILDGDGDFIFVSETTMSVLGLSSDELLGKNSFGFVHPDDIPGIVDQFEALRKQKRAKLGPFRFKVGLGNWRWLETIATDLSDDPAVGGIVTNTRDVTDLKSKEEALKLANERFKLAMKVTSEMIWDWDVITDLVSRGKAFSKIYGYRTDDLSSMEENWFFNIVTKDQERVRNSLMDALVDPQQKKWKEEYRFTKADGEIAHIVDRAYIIRDERGKAIRMVGSALDVSKSRQYLKRIKKQNKTLKDIAWEQSHIVRAPLARLKGLIQLTELEAFEEMSREEMWRHIAASADELDDIVRGIVKKTEEIHAEASEPARKLALLGD